jgi:long-chain acyl-CoA synthetase
LFNTPARNVDIKQVEKRKTGVLSEDIATIVFTSGTTDLPKGVMLTHRNLLSSILSTISVIPIDHTHRVMSFLPLSHIFERVVLFIYLTVGASIYFAESQRHAMVVVQKIRPHYFTAVPRVIEQLYARFKRSERDLGYFQREILKWALKVAEDMSISEDGTVAEKIKLLLAKILVLRKLKRLFGSSVKGIVVGAASLNPVLAGICQAAGIRIREGYGLTESASVISLNRFEPGGNRFGTVGIAVPGVEIKINNPGDEGIGEILVRGENIMIGYLNDPAHTKTAITNKGWLKTGDLGRIVHRRFLQITDRKSSIYKNSSGRFISPQRIENLLLRSDWIEQVIVFGYNKPFNAALVIPDFTLLEEWCRAREIHWTAPRFMVHNPLVKKLFQSIFDDVNRQLKKHERLEKFQLIADTWTTESGFLTPTQKIKRPVIEERYRKEILRIFKL